jgi:hypothetical protein
MRSRKIEREDGKEDGVGAVHERRAEQHAHGVQVVGHAGHDVAGAIALIEARVLLFEVMEEIVAQVELDLARDADQNPALRVEEDAFDQEIPTSNPAKSRICPWSAWSLLQLVDGLLQHLGNCTADGVGGDAGERAPQVSPAVAAHVGEEGAQIAKHGSIVRGCVARPIEGWDMP